MKPVHSLFPALAFVGLLGCATPFPAPADARHIKLERVNSPIIIVEKIWLDRKRGPLAVNGDVIKRLEVEDTTKSHLDVTLFDSDGKVLSSTMENLTPRQIKRQMHRHNAGWYRVEVSLPPAAIARIEVRAHEGGHDNHR